jgi:hypothetical protein
MQLAATVVKSGAQISQFQWDCTRASGRCTDTAVGTQWGRGTEAQTVSSGKMGLAKGGKPGIRLERRDEAVAGGCFLPAAPRARAAPCERRRLRCFLGNRRNRRGGGRGENERPWPVGGRRASRNLGNWV